jgi:hypothetical protein
MTAPVDRISGLDVTLFDHAPAQSTVDDRRSLLALQNAVAEATFGEFAYLEIGSYLGGTLQPYVVDERCRSIVSIDPRPDVVPDDRPELASSSYEENSTAHMLDLLRRIPSADVAKIRTVEASTSDLAPDEFPRPDLCLVDGEHTRTAALRDARFCRAVLEGTGVIAFHDFHIVEPAIEQFVREVGHPVRGYLLKTTVFVVELGAGPSPFDDERVGAQLHRGKAFWRAVNAAHALPLVLRAHQLRRRDRFAHLTR